MNHKVKMKRETGSKPVSEIEGNRTEGYILR